MPRLPNVNATAEEYCQYTTVQWHNQDAFMSFWVERWKRVVDFLRSLHWKQLMEVDLKQIPEWRKFPITNLTLTVFNDMVGQWLQSRVRFSAVPDRPDTIASAELADQVLKYLWDRLGLDEKKIDMAAWLAATGNCDLRIYWNTETGDMMPLAIPDPSGSGQLVPINPGTMQPDPSMPQPIMVDAGEIGVEVIAPQLVRWAMKKSGGVMIGSLVTYDEAVGKYGEQLADRLSYQTVSGPLTTDLMSVFPQTLSSGMPAKEPAALVIEHYLPRSSRFKDGLWWTASDNKVVVTPPQSLPARQIPVIHFRWIPLPGHPTLGLSPLYDITFQNKHHNELLAKKLEWLNKVVPKMIRHTGDGLKYGEINEEPFQEIVVQPGMDPEFPQIPAFPEQFSEVQNQIVDDVMTVAGYKTRRPEAPPPGTSNQSPRVPPRMRNEGEQMMLAVINAKPAWERMGYVLLDYVAKFYTEPRAMAVVGSDKSYQWREFQGSDLDNLQATIHVDELPLYTWNRQSMRDTVLGLMNSQSGAMLFTGPDGQLDRDRVDAAMNAVGIDVAQDAIDPDILEARNENHSWTAAQADPQTGQVNGPGVQPWQNHEAHMSEHSKVPKSLSFKAWPPSKQRAFLQHMGGHEQEIAKAQDQQKQAMLDQEQALRTIRANAETSQDVRTELGKALADALVQMLVPKEAKESESKSKFPAKK